MAEYVVGPAAEFPPGTHRVVKLGRIEVGVFNVNGDFYALPNVCPHQFGPLCAGTVNGTMACYAATGWRFAWVREGEISPAPGTAWSSTSPPAAPLLSPVARAPLPGRRRGWAAQGHRLTSIGAMR